MAVGEAGENEVTRVGASERWNGSVWQAVSMPAPEGSESSSVQSVSCWAANGCMAVGSYRHEDRDLPLAERWNGSTWSAETPPPLTTKKDEYSLTGVSCTSSKDCNALGTEYDGMDTPGIGTIAEYWNGTKWTKKTVTNEIFNISETLKPVERVNLVGLSCTSTESCTGVGSFRVEYYNESLGKRVEERGALVETWNGKAWAVQSIQTGTASRAEVLRGVSCTSSLACTAVGNVVEDNIEGRDDPYVEGWNGTKWTAQPTPRTRLNGGELGAVSCTSSSDCIAVGTERPSENDLEEK